MFQALYESRALKEAITVQTGRNDFGNRGGLLKKSERPQVCVGVWVCGCVWGGGGGGGYIPTAIKYHDRYNTAYVLMNGYFGLKHMVERKYSVGPLIRIIRTKRQATAAPSDHHVLPIECIF